MEDLNLQLDNLVTGGEFSEMLSCVFEECICNAIREFPTMVSNKLVKKMTPIIEKVLENITIKP